MNTEPEPPRQPLKSWIAFFLGFLLFLVLPSAGDYLLRRFAVTLPGLQYWKLLLDTFSMVAGSYLAGLLAPRRPLRHALELGIFFVVFHLIGILGGAMPDLLWRAAASLPCAFFGGRVALAFRSR